MNQQIILYIIYIYIYIYIVFYGKIFFVKRKGLTTKTNHINSAKHDSDSDDSFDIFSENQQSNKEIDLEGL